MKKSIYLMISLMILSFSVNSQNVYSKGNLNNLSTEEIQTHLEKAQKLKKTGTIMSLAGPTLVITSSVLLYNYPGRYDDAAFKLYSSLLVVGIGTTLIGLPKLIIGSSRVKRINNLERNSRTGLIINLKPDIHCNQLTQNYQPTITLNIRF